MAEPPMIDARHTLAAAVGRRLYGYRPSAVVRLARETNAVFRLEFGGLPAKVIKLAGRPAGALREQALLSKLRAPRWGLPVPAVEFTQADVPARWEVDGATFDRPAALTVMRHEPGMPLADAVLRGEAWADDALRSAGAFAARLADLPPALLAGAGRAQSFDQAEHMLRWFRVAVEAFDLGRLMPRLELVAALRQQPATSMGHGELGLESFLADPAVGGVRLCVCGWEAARPGRPLADLAGLLTSLAASPTHDVGRLAFLRRRAVDGYAATRPLEADDAAELAAWETSFHLAAARRRLDRGDRASAAHRAMLANTVAGE